jgi:toxin ParE1/3/4
MKSFIRSVARDDILRQYRYLLLDQDSPRSAERFLKNVESAINQLCRRPALGAPSKWKNPFLQGLRSWPVEGFPAVRIYYLVSANTLRVVRVLHGKRDVRSILESEGDSP